MAWSDAGWIAVVALRPGRRYLHESGPELRPSTRAGETDSGSGSDTVTSEPSLKLLIGGEGTARKIHLTTSGACERYRARHQPAVITPVESDPRTRFPRLVLHVGGLVELFIVVDSERGDTASATSRRNSAGSTKLRVEKARSNAGEDEEGAKSMKVRHTHTPRKCRDLGIVPFDWEGERSAPEYAEVVCIMGVFPDVLAGEDQIPP